MNRDGGAYNLPTTYDRNLVTRSSATSHTTCLMKFAITSQLGIDYAFGCVT